MKTMVNSPSTRPGVQAVLTRIGAAIGLAGVSLAVLTGCSFSAGVNLTVPATAVADAAAGALEAEIGTRPEMDCGTDQVDLVNDTVVDCELTDPDTGSVFDAPVTIKDVDGTNYTVAVQVADAPKS